jgi:hypothetical protein
VILNTEVYESIDSQMLPITVIFTVHPVDAYFHPLTNDFEKSSRCELLFEKCNVVRLTLRPFGQVQPFVGNFELFNARCHDFFRHMTDIYLYWTSTPLGSFLHILYKYKSISCRSGVLE